MQELAPALSSRSARTTTCGWIGRNEGNRVFLLRIVMSFMQRPAGACDAVIKREQEDKPAASAPALQKLAAGFASGIGAVENPRSRSAEPSWR